jgi:signal transduction histidine kinase
MSHNPVMDALLGSVSGMLAVLNEQRQVLAVNDELLRALGIEFEGELLGLRPGEVLGCIHSAKMPDGCGTSQACASCGAVIAILSSMTRNHTAERDCFLTLERGGTLADVYFHVTSTPISLEGRRYLLLLLRDQTLEQQRAVLERVFFHDISDLVMALMVNSRLMVQETDLQRLQMQAKDLFHLSSRLAKEVEFQRILSCGDQHSYQVSFKEILLEPFLTDLHLQATSHPAAQGRQLELGRLAQQDRRLVSDRTLLQRALLNLLVNAFEATQPGGQVRLWVEDAAQGVCFYVWNPGEIPAALAPRIFQRNFSTKGESGRGVGAYSARLFCETYLGGQVSFTSTLQDGTTFRLWLPDQVVES